MDCAVPSCEPSNQNPTAITIVYLEYSLRALYDSVLDVLCVGSYYVCHFLPCSAWVTPKEPMKSTRESPANEVTNE